MFNFSDLFSNMFESGRQTVSNYFEQSDWSKILSDAAQAGSALYSVYSMYQSANSAKSSPAVVSTTEMTPKTAQPAVIQQNQNQSMFLLDPASGKKTTKKTGLSSLKSSTGMTLF